MPIPDISAGLPEPEPDPFEEMRRAVVEVANKRLSGEITEIEWENSIKKITGEK